MSIKTREQEVGLCSVCGRRCAVRHGRVSVHGYQKKGYGQIIGECLGSGRPHYGSEKAPAAINAVIESLENTLSKNAKNLNPLELTLAELVASGPHPHGKVKRVKDRIAEIKLAEIAIPEFITFLKSRASKWKPLNTKTILVDSQGRSVEEVEAAKKAADLKKSEREAALKVKQDAANERALKAEKVLAEYLALIGAQNYYRLFFKGELVISFAEGFDSENAIYEKFNAAAKAHWDKVSEGETYSVSVFHLFYGDGRTASDGKGKRFFEYSYHLKEKDYFARYK